jgi:hypothetical protein
VQVDELRQYSVLSELRHGQRAQASARFAESPVLLPLGDTCQLEAYGAFTF